MKERPWAEHLTSLSKRGVGVLSNVFTKVVHAWSSCLYIPRPVPNTCGLCDLVYKINYRFKDIHWKFKTVQFCTLQPYYACTIVSWKSAHGRSTYLTSSSKKGVGILSNISAFKRKRAPMSCLQWNIIMYNRATSGFKFKSRTAWANMLQPDFKPLTGF